MKNYKILYAYYPFKKETVKPLVEMVEANTLEYVSLQSATQTNLVIQLMNELRQL